MTLSTAVAWVWSMNACGRNACSMTSTDGLGDDGSIRLRALDPDKFLVCDRLRPAQPPQRRKPHRRQSCRLDRRHVGTGRLDAQNLDLVAAEVARVRLERGIAAAMQHKPGIAAEQPRRVDAERKLTVEA